MKTSKKIRQELKSTLGYNARQVSVSVKDYNSIYFTVRTKEVDFNSVLEFAHKYEAVNRCPITHDILSGGNVYVNVSYSEALEVELIEEQRSTAKRIIESENLVDEETGFYLIDLPMYNTFKLINRNTNKSTQVWGNKEHNIARALVDLNS